MIILTFLDTDGREIFKTLDFECSLEDATIDGSTIAEENGWELVAVTENN